MRSKSNQCDDDDDADYNHTPPTIRNIYPAFVAVNVNVLVASISYILTH